MKIAYKAKKIFAENEVFDNAFLIVEDGKVSSIEKNYDGEYVDYSDKYLAPGLVDTHVHGYHNVDITDGEPGSLNTMSKGVLQMGVTSFLRTPRSTSYPNSTLFRSLRVE